MKNFTSLLVALFLVYLDLTIACAWECEVTVGGPETIKLGDQVTLSASGSPAGGSYSWSRTPNLVPNGSTATITGFQPTYSEYIKVIGYYTSPKGKKCSDTKWLWACTCSLTAISGPAQAEVGEEIVLSTQADPAGGNYTWSINSGSGTLSSNGSSATFVADQLGTMEIKASYIPPKGGEPCTVYHSVEIEDECNVVLSGDMYQRPVCRPVKFYAKGEPDSGQCAWNPTADFSANGCGATYNGKAAGYYTVTTTYTTPNGSSCEDSKGILSYKLVGNMTPKQSCYVSGTSFSADDFIITTSPAGYQDNILLSPASVSTLNKTEQKRVWASLLCTQDPSKISTLVTVVNEKKSTGLSVKVEVPNYIKNPLEMIGLANSLDFSVKNDFKESLRCCLDEVAPNKSGSTRVQIALDGEVPFLGIPLPKTIKNYVSADAIKATASGNASVSLNGKYDGCMDLTEWDGGGALNATAGISGELKAKAKEAFLLKALLKGESDINQTLNVNNLTLVTKSDWGGLVVKGEVIIQFKLKDIVSENIQWLAIEPDKLPTKALKLPLLN